jgi:PHD/YefM family antitoxin component YafN of YafNO toxin-antitoxin module
VYIPAVRRPSNAVKRCQTLSNNLLDSVYDTCYTKRAMFTPIRITTRDFMRNYKRVIDQVKATREPAVVVSQHQPQVAIVSLDDLDQLAQLHAHSGGQALLETAHRVRTLLKDTPMPADLSTRHDHYLWDAEVVEDRSKQASKEEGSGAQQTR